MLTDIQRAVIISGRSPGYVRENQEELKRYLNITSIFLHFIHSADTIYRPIWARLYVIIQTILAFRLVLIYDLLEERIDDVIYIYIFVSFII